MTGPAAEAYIIMRADGTLLPRDVKDFAGDAGEEAAQEFSDQWDAELDERQQRSLKEFRGRINKVLDDPSLFKSLRKSGETSDQTFKRLNKTLEELGERGLVSQRVFYGFQSAFQKYKEIDRYNQSIGELGRNLREAANRQREMFSKDIERSMTSYQNDWSALVKKFGSVDAAGAALEKRLREMTDANADFRGEADRTRAAFDSWRKAQSAAAEESERNEKKVTALSKSMDGLKQAEEEWFAQAVKRAAITGQWDDYVRKMGDVDTAYRQLKSRTDEARKANSDYADTMDSLLEAFGYWRKDQEESIRLSEEQAKSDKAVADRKKSVAEQTRRVAEAARLEQKAQAEATVERERHIKSLSAIERGMNDVTDSAKRMLDKLVIKATDTGDWETVIRHVDDLGEKMGEATEEGQHLNRMNDEVRTRLRYLSDEGALTSESFDRITESLDRYLAKSGHMPTLLEKNVSAMEKARSAYRGARLEIERGNPARVKFEANIRKIGETSSRMFGKGSRSDIVHYFGSLVGGLTSFVTLGPVKVFHGASKALGAFKATFSTLTAEVSQGGAGMAKIPALFAAFGASAAAAIPSLGAMALGFVVLAPAISAAASAVSLLVANLLTLVGVIVQAIVAPLAAAVPAIAAFGAGALIAGGAIAMWAKKSGPLKSAISGVKNELQKLSTRIKPAMDGMARLFGSGAKSLVRSFGDSVENVLNDMYQKFKDPAMDQFYRQWSVSMPKAFESLGRAISAFSTGLIAFFTPILPFAEELAAKIRDSSEAFREWAMSARGQNAIADWMERAWSNAKDLWQGLKNLYIALQNIISIGTRGPGKSFVRWLRDISERFKEWTESKKGRAEIKQWFEDSAEFAKDLRVVIEKLAAAFDELDSPEGRRSLNAFMTLFEHVGAAAQLAAEIVRGVNWVSQGGLMEAVEEVDMLKGSLDDLVHGNFGSAFKRIKDGWEGDIVDAYNSVAEFFGQEKISSLSEGWEQGVENWKSIFDGLGGWLSNKGSDIGGTIAGWWEGIDWGGIWSSVSGAVSGWFGSFKGWLSQKGSEIGSTIKGWFDIDWGGVWSSITGAVSEWYGSFKGWLSQKGSEIWSTIRGWFDIDWGGVFSSIGGTIQSALSGIAYSIGYAVGSWVRLVLDFPNKVMSINWGGLWSGLLSSLSSAGSAIGDWISRTWGQFTEWASGLPGKISAGLSAAGSAISGWASSSWSAISGWVSQTWSSFTTWASGIPGQISAGLSAAGSAISGWTSSAWSAISGWVSQTWSSFSTWAAGIPGQISAGLQSAWSAVTTWAGNMKTALTGWWDGIDWSGLWTSVREGISQGASAIWGWLSETGRKMFDSFVQGVKDALGIASPSQKMIEIMGYVGQGILQGLMAIPGMLLGVAERLFGPIVDSAMALPGKVVSALGTLGSSIMGVFGSIGPLIGSTVSGWWSSVSGKLSGWGGKAKNALGSLKSSIGSVLESVKNVISNKAGQWWGAAKGKLTGWGGKAKSALSGLKSGVGGALGAVKSTISNKAGQWWGAAKSKLSGWGKKAKGALSPFKSSIGSVLGSIKSSISTKTGQWWGAVGGKLKSWGGKAKSALSSFVSSVKSRFDQAKKSATNKAGDLVSKARGKLSNMGSKASSALSNLKSRVSSRFESAKKSAVDKARSLVDNARSKYRTMPGKASSALSALRGKVQSRFNSAKSAATEKARALVSDAQSKFRQVAPKAYSALSSLASRVRSRFNSAKEAARGKLRETVNSSSMLRSMAGRLSSALSGVKDAITRPFEAAKDAVSRTLGSIRSLASRASSIGSGIKAHIPKFATGGTVFGPQQAVIGEAGPEAVVPLNRPLDQVDPSVRWLSAIAQGKASPGGGAVVQSGAITVVSPYSDPQLVANRVLDDLVSNL